MGGIVSSGVNQTQKNAVDKALEEAQEAEKYKHKILLLGAGECGKSTVVKQIKMIWKVGGGPSDREKMETILPLRRNCIEAIQTILEASKKLGISLENQEYQQDFDAIVNLDSNAALTPELATKIDTLWKDTGIKKTFERR
jgi:predicted Ser/Thr protein kinase